MKVSGFVLIALGVLALIWQSFSYTTTDKVVDLGPLEVNKESTKRVPVPPIAGVGAVVGGVILVAFSGRK